MGACGDWLPVYGASGMHDLYIGDEAVVDVRRFSLDGKQNKSLRQSVGRVEKAGYRVEFFDPAQLEPELEAKLRGLMTESRRGDVERGFSMTLGPRLRARRSRACCSRSRSTATTTPAGLLPVRARARDRRLVARPHAPQRGRRTCPTASPSSSWPRRLRICREQRVFFFFVAGAGTVLLVRSRTTPGFTFVVMPYVFVAFSVLTLVADVHRDRWVNAVLAAVNATLAAYAIIAYVGVGNSIVDVWNNILSWLYKPQRSAPVKAAAPRVAIVATPDAHWSATLTYASADGVRRAERRSASPRSEFAGDRRRAADRVQDGAPATAALAESGGRR